MEEGTKMTYTYVTTKCTRKFILPNNKILTTPNRALKGLFAWSFRSQRTSILTNHPESDLIVIPNT